MRINICILYLYIFPLYLAFQYPRILIEYQDIFAYAISLKAFIVCLHHFKKIEYLKYVLYSILLITILVLTKYDYSKWQIHLEPYRLFSSLTYLIVFIEFLKKYSYLHKKRYLTFLIIITFLYAMAPIYNYFTRLDYKGGNGMMYHIVGMYMIFLALQLHINNVYEKFDRNILFIVLILIFNLFISKTRGTFPLINMLLVFNIFIFNYKSLENIKRLNISKFIFMYISIILIGLFPIFVFFGYGDFVLKVFITRSGNYSLDPSTITGRPQLFLEWGRYFLDTLVFLKNTALPTGVGTHNTFYHLMLGYGYFGFLIYLFFIGLLLKKIIKIKTNATSRIILYLILISVVMLFNVASLFFDNDMAVWIGVFLFFYVLENNSKINRLHNVRYSRDMVNK